MMRQRILTLTDGQQILAQDFPGELTISVEHDDASVESEKEIKTKDFESLAIKAMTHDIKVDTISRRTTLMKKTSPKKRKQANG